MTTAETTTAAAADAAANGNGNGTTKTAKQAVRMQFLCEKRQLEFKEEIPASLIGVEAVFKPAMPKMFELTLAPIVMKHAAEALDACEDKCSAKGCERDATTIVATPMSVSSLRAAAPPPLFPFSPFRGPPPLPFSSPACESI